MHGSWVLLSLLMIFDSYGNATGPPAKDDHGSTALSQPPQFQRCANFQATYAGAYLVHRDLFMEVKWKAVGALEFATRQLWILTQRGKISKSSGCGLKPSAATRDDFYILHLSGIEHQLMRRTGLQKAMASMSLISTATLKATVEHFRHSRHRGAPRHRRVVTVIPFYGKQGFLGLANATSTSPGKATYLRGVGNSHTMASPEMKLMQLMSVAVSAQELFGHVVVGVCGEAERSSLRKFVDEMVSVMGEWALPAEFVRNFQITTLECGNMPVYLPFFLLQWAQRQFSNADGGADGETWTDQFDALYFTEADNVVRMSDAMTEYSLESLLGHPSGRNCYFAPTRFERVTSGRLDRPFDARVMVGQNACGEAPEGNTLTAASTSKGAFWDSKHANVHFYTYEKSGKPGGLLEEK